MLLPVALSLILPGMASAQSHGQRYDYVTKVNVGEDNFLYISVSGDYANDHGCLRPFYARSEFPLTDERTKSWLAIAMESFRSRKEVWVENNGCMALPAGYLILAKIQLQQ